MLKDPFLAFCSFLNTLHNHPHPYPCLHVLSPFTSSAQISPAPEPHPHSWMEFLHACLNNATNLIWELDPTYQNVLVLPVSLHIISIIIFPLLKLETVISFSSSFSLSISKWSPGFANSDLNCHSSLSPTYLLSATALVWAFVCFHFNAWNSPSQYLPALISPLRAIQPSHLSVPSNDTIKDRILTNVIMLFFISAKRCSTFLQNKVNVSQ